MNDQFPGRCRLLSFVDRKVANTLTVSREEEWLSHLRPEVSHAGRVVVIYAPGDSNFFFSHRFQWRLCHFKQLNGGEETDDVVKFCVSSRTMLLGSHRVRVY